MIFAFLFFQDDGLSSVKRVANYANRIKPPNGVSKMDSNGFATPIPSPSPDELDDDGNLNYDRVDIKRPLMQILIE